MNKAKLAGIGVGLLFLALWVVPIARAVAFLHRARQEQDNDGSIDSLNDAHFAVAIIAGYAVSLLCCLFLSWLIYRRPGIAFGVPTALFVWKVAEVIWAHPEAVIVFFPTIDPFRFAGFHLALAAVAAAFSYFPPKPISL